MSNIHMNDELLLWNKVKDTMRVPLIELSLKSSEAVRCSLLGLMMILARYKFPTRMLQNKKHLKVLDLGCSDGLGDWMISQNCDCDQILGVDFDTEAIAWAQRNIIDPKCHFIEADFLKEVDFFEDGADCVVSMDVIEHIPQDKEKDFLKTITKNLNENGIAFIGTPNERMYPFAGPQGKIGHINNYSQDRLYELLSGFFHNVFIFGMNDEILHTGFYPFTCYIIALCCDMKRA